MVEVDLGHVAARAPASSSTPAPTSATSPAPTALTSADGVGWVRPSLPAQATGSDRHRPARSSHAARPHHSDLGRRATVDGGRTLRVYRQAPEVNSMTATPSSLVRSLLATAVVSLLAAATLVTGFLVPAGRRLPALRRGSRLHHIRSYEDAGLPSPTGPARRMTLEEKVGQMTQTERYQVYDDASADHRPGTSARSCPAAAPRRRENTPRRGPTWSTASSRPRSTPASASR